MQPKEDHSRKRPIGGRNNGTAHSLMGKSEVIVSHSPEVGGEEHLPTVEGVVWNPSR